MKTSEMIAMLENNPKLRFRRKGWDALEQQVGVDEDNFVGLWYPDGRHLGVCLFTNQDDWELVRTPVTWQEAIQAWVDGKTIRIEECPGCSHGGHCLSRTTILKMHSELRVCLPAFNGKWYIDE